METKRYTFTLDKKDMDKIREIAAKDKSNCSHIVRRIISLYLSKNGR